MFARQHSVCNWCLPKLIKESHYYPYKQNKSSVQAHTKSVEILSGPAVNFWAPFFFPLKTIHKVEINTSPGCYMVYLKMFNATGHLGDYFNGFLPSHVLTVNLNIFKLILSPMLKSSWKQEGSIVKGWRNQKIKHSIQNKKLNKRNMS